MSEHLRAAVIVMMTIVVVFVAILFAAWLLKDEDPEMQLPLLVIGGLVALLGMLAVMAVAFKTVDLADRTQALGLPDGTVRAVIALSLILIFAVVTVYLFSDLSNEADDSCTTSVADLQRQILRLKFAPAAPTTTAPTPTAGAATTPATPPPGTPPATPAATTSAAPPVVIVPAANEPPHVARGAAQDFAKQLLIMLGTLITSITSFYFASRTQADTPAAAQKPAPVVPTISDISPRRIPSSDREGQATLVALGKGMLSVNEVSLRKPGVVIAAQEVSSNESHVRFTLPPDMLRGQWDVVFRTSDGAEAVMHPGIEIG